jgi:hypothetical protein
MFLRFRRDSKVREAVIATGHSRAMGRTILAADGRALSPEGTRLWNFELVSELDAEKIPLRNSNCSNVWKCLK